MMLIVSVIMVSKSPLLPNPVNTLHALTFCCWVACMYMSGMPGLHSGWHVHISHGVPVLFSGGMCCHARYGAGAWGTMHTAQERGLLHWETTQ